MPGSHPLKLRALHLHLLSKYRRRKSRRTLSQCSVLHRLFFCETQLLLQLLCHQRAPSPFCKQISKLERLLSRGVALVHSLSRASPAPCLYLARQPCYRHSRLKLSERAVTPAATHERPFLKLPCPWLTALKRRKSQR